MKWENKRSLKKNILRLLLFNVSFFLLTACGYKPVSHYTKQTIAAPLYLEVKLSSKEPDSGLFLKDALRDALIHRLGIRVTSASTAPSQMKVTYDAITYTALGYDANGYVERYRVNMVTTFDLKTKGRVFVRKLHTTHEADVSPSALESSRAKQEAIKACSQKAVDQFVAFMAAQSVKNSDGK